MHLYNNYNNRLRDSDLHSTKLFFQSQNLEDEGTSIKRGDKGRFFNKNPHRFSTLPNRSSTGWRLVQGRR
ncbi:hypothetical protein L6452_36977 [Arctium lappa]|uniref:Uncharacterized protein n=1 Tax=Arctium lappa TaxID=4217 RepID=A0ACB8Y145_ARCLA|nr:hypothetical protein L6452_36977 [Arctium lappa]